MGVAAVGQSGDQHLQSSAHEIAKDAVALVDYEVDSANLALTKDIFDFDLNSVSENDEGRQCFFCNGVCCCDDVRPEKDGMCGCWKPCNKHNNVCFVEGKCHSCGGKCTCVFEIGGDYHCPSF